MDIDLLLICQDKEQYNRFKPYVKEHILSKEVALIYNTIDAFYKQFPAVNKIDWSAFQSFFNVYRAAQIRRETAQAFNNIFDKLRSSPTSMTTETVLEYYITQDYAHLVAEAALEVREGKTPFDEIAELVQKHDKELGRAINPADFFVTHGIAGVLAEASAAGFNWRLNELNRSCGPVRKGDFILVAAFVETGKTTFTASEVSHMATQIKAQRESAASHHASSARLHTG